MQSPFSRLFFVGFGLGLCTVHNPVFAQEISSDQSTDIPVYSWSGVPNAEVDGADASSSVQAYPSGFDASVSQAENLRQAPQQGAGTRLDDSQAYEALGLQFGSFRLYPSISFLGHVTDNIGNSENKEEAVSGSSVLGLSGKSEWSRHSMSFSGSAELEGYHEPEFKPDHALSFDSTLRLDLGDETGFILNGAANRERESANNTELLATGGSASMLTSLSGGGVLTHDAGLVSMQLRASINYNDYDDDDDRNYSIYTIGSRLGYHATDQVTPFVDVEGARTRYVHKSDKLDGDSLRGSVGIEVGDRAVLSGEVSLGYMVWRPDNKTLDDEDLVYANASLVWSPNPLWTFTSGFESSIGSTSTDARVVVDRTAKVGAEYKMRRNFTLSANADVTSEIYRGSSQRDWLFNGDLSAVYKLNRNVQLIGSLEHERRDSNIAGESYNTNTISFGVKLQK